MAPLIDHLVPYDLQHDYEMIWSVSSQDYDQRMSIDNEDDDDDDNVDVSYHNDNCAESQHMYDMHMMAARCVTLSMV